MLFSQKMIQSQTWSKYFKDSTKFSLFYCIWQPLQCDKQM